MLVAPVARVVASALGLTVASSCARNMMQTVEIRKQLAAAAALTTTCPADDEGTMLLDNPLAPASLESSETTNLSLSDRLRGMNRRELLRVFANGRAPTESELSEWFSCESSSNNNKNEEYCEWDAMLLDNDGMIMNASPNFFTHQLFGGNLLPWRLLGKARKWKGRWNGKAFAMPTVTPTAGTGINRFSTKEKSNFLRHTFDYDVKKSQVLQGGKALRLDYWRYQSLPLSLWWSMHDEVRVIDAPHKSKMDDNDDEKIVLLGMGWMGWSGGALNCSPFLLERSRQ